MFRPSATSTYVETVKSTPPKSEPAVVMTGMLSIGSRNRKIAKRTQRPIFRALGSESTRSLNPGRGALTVEPAVVVEVLMRGPFRATHRAGRWAGRGG